MEAMIQMEHIQKIFQEKTALKDVSCFVAKQEIFGLLGPSGAGKTTIINILTGQMRPTSGKASIFETDTTQLTDEIYAKIGMVLDDSGLYVRLSCYDNLALFADIYGVSKSVIPDVLKLVELEGSEKKAVNKLSKGMTQRLVLARAIMHKPQLLFLDEPTSGLDPTTAQKIHKLILALRAQGSTVFLTTHNMEEATQLCDHVALLNEGTIVEYGAPDEICRKYNKEQKVHVLLKDGSEAELANDSSAAEQIAAYFAAEQVAAIHSSEPNLETVFIALTGRKLVEA